MILRHCLFLAFLLGTSATAETMPASCVGVDPDWSIEFDGDTAQFTYGRSFSFDIPQRNNAENRTWPKAMTLFEVQQRYTAIVIIDQTACSTPHGDYSHSAYVLTQRASTPILLQGCCTVPTP